MQALSFEVMGLVVVTQTCDIVRACASRPYIEVAPLVRVSEDDLHDVKRGWRPAHATLPSLEKSIVATWKRTPGYTRDADGRAFAQTLARKRVRFAFPDDFTAVARKLHARLSDKHDKNSDEGRGLRALLEIRVCAALSWNAPSVEIFIWFIRDPHDADFDGKSWADLLKLWLKLAAATGRFTTVEGQVVTLSEMTAEDYVGSDPPRPRTSISAASRSPGFPLTSPKARPMFSRRGAATDRSPRRRQDAVAHWQG